MLNAHEAAERLNVSKASVYRFLHSGSLPYVQYGANGSVRIPEVELEMWIAARRKDTNDD